MMKTTRVMAPLAALLCLLAGVSTSAPIGTAFTYQGLLNDAGLPATGAYDFQFKLFDAASAGAQVGSTVLRNDVAVSAGLFSVSLDFGAASFAGQSRFLEIGVRPGVSTGAYTLLGARQELTPSPNALFATSAGSAATATTATTATTVAAGAVDTPQLAGGAVTSAKLGTGAVTAGAIASGQVVKNLNGVTDAVTITGSGGATVSTVGNTITVAAATAPTDCTPVGALVIGAAGDTTLVGYAQFGGTLGDGWTATATLGAPSARNSHTAVWTGSKMIVWGGYGGTELNTGGQYDPVANSWTATATTAGVPGARNSHTAVWTGTRMIVWGGVVAGSSLTNTGGQYDPVGNSWSQTAITTGVPSARYIHTAVWTGSRMIVWGGLGPGFSAVNTGGQYDPVSNAWTATATSAGVPSARHYHTAVWTGSRMIVWGGSPSLNTGGQYDPVANSWTTTATTGVPDGRYAHTAVWTGSRMIVWGGIVATYTNTGGQYDPVANSWTATATTAGVPGGRAAHTAVWTGSRMLIWGGNQGGPFPNTGGQYDPVANSWTATATSAGVPSGRTSHTTVWTGAKMIVWGGYDGTTQNTGGQWFELSYFVKTGASSPPAL